MYIHPFVVGVITTILVELAILFAVAAHKSKRR